MTKRQLQVLKTLYRAEGYVTFAEMAQLLNVSVKTVRNDVAAINVMLNAQETGQIQTKAHAGMKLELTKMQWETLLGKDAGKLPDQKEENEILFQVIQELLKNRELVAQNFSDKTLVSRGTLERVLEQARGWFRRQHILFETRRGKGITITCTEYNFRIAVLGFYQEFKEFLYCEERKRRSRFTSVNVFEYSTLTTLLNGFDTDLVLEMIVKLEQTYGFHFSYTSNLQLLILLSLCVIRFRKGFPVNMVVPEVCKVDGDSDALLSQDLVNGLEQQFHISLPQEERAFIQFAIAISEIREFVDDKSRRFLEYHNIELCRFTVKFVNLCSEVANVNLRDDTYFVHQIFLQLKPMIARLKYQTGFKNPLLKQIKAKYPNTMAMAWAAGNMFDKELELDMNEHEVGFLALHIGGAIERRISGFRTCIVCDYGIGISQILREKIERTIRDLQITGVFSNRDIRKIKSEECDFIISTIPLDGIHINKEVIVVEHLLLPENVQAIEDKMKALRSAKLHLKKSLRQIETERKLFHKDFIHLDIAAADKESILKQMCRKLENMGYVSEEFVTSVLERELHTSTEVGKGIALPHGHSRYVNRSVVSFARLQTPIFWFDENEEVDLIFLLAFDLDETPGIKKEILKFYKDFASFLDREEAIAAVRNAEEANTFIELLNQW